MKINVGSKNEIKVDAVREIILEYPRLADAEVASIEIASKVSDQPKSLEETLKGAINRARGAFSDCDYSFGIESGLMRVPNTKTGHMDFTSCAIYDGKEFYLGLSSAWEAPKQVVDFMINDGFDMNEAFYRAGLTDNPKLGNAEGAIGLLTKGRLTRKEYTKQAIRTALIHLDK